MRRALLAMLLLAVVAPPAADAATRKIAKLPSSWQKGANVPAFSSGDYDAKTFSPWLTRLRNNAHVDYVSFVSYWYQYWSDPLRRDDILAPDIHPLYGSKTVSLDSERKAIEKAKKLGLRIVIKPVVDVGRTSASAGDRADIDFGDATARGNWFGSYKFMLSQYARLARDTDADMLVIGTGLDRMTDDPEEQQEWRDIVDQIRSGALMGDGKGYHGALTYGASWDTLYGDAAEPKAYGFFWDKLDFVGVEAFWPLVDGKGADHDNPSLTRLRTGWAQNFVRNGVPPAIALRALNRKYGKPVLFTGLGYLSRGGTAADPGKGDAAQRAAGGRYNPTAQARAYRAAFDFWSMVGRREHWFRGIYWWNWSPTLTNVKNGDYSPQGKPAETELCLRHLGRFTKACRPSSPPRTG